MTGVVTRNVIEFLTSTSDCMLVSSEICIRDVLYIARRHNVKINDSCNKTFKYDANGPKVLLSYL